MPGRRLISRLAALSAFLVAVAVGLWLLDLRPLVVVAVMVLAYAIAATIEWLSWRQDRPWAAVEEPTPEVAGAPPTPEPDQAGGLWLLRGEEPAERERPEPTAAPSLPVEEPGATVGPDAGREPEPQPEAERPEPEPEREPPLEPEPPPAPEAVPPPPPAPLRPVPPPPPPEAEPPPVVAARPAPPQETAVVDLRRRGAQPREWNLWELERIAREEARRDPGRAEEWSYLFLHLRRFANADGALPTEFDGLVRESFGGLLDRAPGV